MTSLALDPVDLTDPASFPDGPPHAFLARLRAEAPVWWHPDGLRRDGFWVVTRYDDVRAILLQPTVFINAKGITIEPGEPAGLGESEAERGQGALSYTDPPQHGPLRKVLAQHFTPSRIRALGPLVRGHADRLVQRLADAGGGDFVTEVVDPYPLRVLAAVLGLPAETEQALHQFVGALGDAKSGAARRPDSTDPARAAATIEFLDRRARTGDGADGQPRPRPHLGDGHRHRRRGGPGRRAHRRHPHPARHRRATRRPAAPAGSACRYCWNIPSSGHCVTADPALVPAAVEEILRFRPPVQYTRRTAAAEAPLSARDDAHTAKAGDTVYLSIASANRDPDVFDDADTFDITRPAGRARISSLGVGAHFCLGAALARLELGQPVHRRRRDRPRHQPCRAGQARPQQPVHPLAGRACPSRSDRAASPGSGRRAPPRSPRRRTACVPGIPGTERG